MSPYQPKILLQQAETVYLGSENHGTITVQPDGFRIEFDAGQQLDAGILIRRHIVAYRVAGDRVARIAPIAAEPGGFLDEWVSMPWEEAERWIEPSEFAILSEWHERLRAARLKNDIHFFTRFLFDPPAFKMKKGLWQVGIRFSPYPEGGALPAGMPEEVYFTVGLTDGAYLLRSVSPLKRETGR